MKSHHDERQIVFHGELSTFESSDGSETEGRTMQVLSVFTVGNGNFCRGAHIERYVLPSKRVISAVLIGNSSQPTYLPVKGVRLSEKGGQLAPLLMAASIDLRFPWTPAFVAAASRDVTDGSCAIVVLRTDVGKENFHCGQYPDLPLPGWTLRKGRILPCRQKRFGLRPRRGAVHVVQIVPPGAVFSTVVNHRQDLQVLHSYKFNGETIEPVPPAFAML